MSTKNQLVGAWCGIAFMAVFFVGWAGLAGWLPPPSPNDSADEIAAMFRENTTQIRLGLLLILFACALLIPWGAAIAAQVRRAERRAGFLTYCQIIAAVCLVLEFIFPLMVWQAAAFRPEDTEFVQRFNDLAWLPFLGITCTALMQGIVLAAVTLQDEREQPVFPRWFAYFNLWCATLFTPGSLIVFFKTGPLAWDGVLAWWLVLVVFTTWMVGISVVLMRAIRGEEREESLP